MLQEREFDGRGRWVTISGRPVFIADARPEEVNLDALRPPELAPEADITIVKMADGRVRREYSDAWIQKTARYKFAKVTEIERNRSEIESGLASDVRDALKRGGLRGDKNAQASLCALLIAKTGMRPGSPGQGTRIKSGDGKGTLQRTYGATTVQKRHVTISGDEVRFQYLGKSGVQRDVRIKDPLIARGVKALIDSKDGSADVFDGVDEKQLNRRFKRFNSHYKAKDFRAAIAMQEASAAIADVLSGDRKPVPSDAEKARRLARRLVNDLGKKISSKLGNTPAVAISNYTNPALVEQFLFEYGIPRSVLESDAEHLRQEYMRVALTLPVPSKVPMLTILYGGEAVSEWTSRFLSDREDAEDAESQHWEELPA
jgi:hypothetical protein